MIKTSLRDPKKIWSSIEGINGPATGRRFRKLAAHINNIAEEFGGPILDAARRLDETKNYKQHEICRIIKNELREEIVQGKISERCIEGILPRKYKRKYIKSELNSASTEAKPLAIVDIQKGKTQEEEEQLVSNHQQDGSHSENGSRAIKDDYQHVDNELSDAIDRVFMNDQIKKLSHESDCMLDIISNARLEIQQELFLAYRSFLEQIIDSANHRIDISAPSQLSTRVQQDKQ
jgi:hypothetical protein